MKAQDTTPKPSWDVKKLVAVHAIAIVLLITFFLPPLNAAWAWLDEVFFFFMNDTLALDNSWPELVAFTNTRLFDKISTFLLIAVLLSYIALGGRKNFVRRTAMSTFVGLYMLLLTWGRRELGLFEYGRLSPTLIYENFTDLRDVFPEMSPKTRSAQAFPSDHAIACFIFLALVWRFMGKKYAVPVLLLLPFFVMPRMIGGAHWLSDTLVGGGFYALLVIAWAYYTPIAARCTGALDSAMNKTISVVKSRIPLLMRKN